MAATQHAASSRMETRTGIRGGVERMGNLATTATRRQTTHSSPKLVNGLVGKKAKQVACGGYHTVVWCTADGRAYSSFGIGEWG